MRTVVGIFLQPNLKGGLYDSNVRPCPSRNIRGDAGSFAFIALHKLSELLQSVKRSLPCTWRTHDRSVDLVDPLAAVSAPRESEPRSPLFPFRYPLSFPMEGSKG